MVGPLRTELDIVQRKTDIAGRNGVNHSLVQLFVLELIQNVKLFHLQVIPAGFQQLVVRLVSIHDRKTLLNLHNELNQDPSFHPNYIQIFERII